mmetsp:Transcript_43863/g.82294  ORF Transcript_43863/g.82294 Transcript_43863/m.82294 type:complete len:677 (-) Transcript_43863:97-2127(-)
MQFLWCAFLQLAIIATPVQSSAVTPITKVIQMLEGMAETGKVEMQEEKVRWAEASTWCRETEAEKQRIIKAQSDAIVQLEAEIEKAEADAAKLQTETDALNAEIDGWKSESAKATAERKAEKAEYTKMHVDFTESITALEGAIKVLKAREADVPQALVQLRRVTALAMLPSSARHVLSSFLQAGVNAQDGAPEANAYEFQSGSIVDMLEKLRTRFIGERRALDKEEMNRKFNYELIMQKLTDNTGNAEDSVSKKTVLKAGRKQDSAEAKGSLDLTTAAKAADSKYLADMQAECSLKAEDFAKRQTLRGQELEAIAEAIKIMSSETVSGAGAKYLPASLIQADGKRRAVMLAQLRSTSSHPEQVRKRTASMLAKAASQGNSRLLAMVANHVSEDPFAKVKKLIKDLLVKLMEEASAEATQKSFCDTELATNKANREKYTSEVDAATSEAEELTAKLNRLNQKIADLSDDIAGINEAIAEAEAARQKDKAANTVTIKEAQEAQDAVTKATEVLKTFYEAASTATSFAQRQSQTPTEDMPTTFDKPYTGMQGSNTGIIGMLEVIQSDFARLEADTTTAEEEASREHEQFLADSKKDIDTKEYEKMHDGFEKTRTEKALSDTKKSLKHSQAELDAALKYYENLKPQCVDKGLSYEVRKVGREEEIKSLQEALAMLNAENV